MLADQPFADVQLKIADFFADKKPSDTLLLYFSGHGVREANSGRLYLALKDTIYGRLTGSAVGSFFLKDEMDNSRARKQVLILDCCHSGAFATGAKGALETRVIFPETFDGRGRMVITATDALQHAWEGDRIIRGTPNSLFTHFLIEGLKNGAADTNQDGKVTADELYNYVFEKVVEQTPDQKPRKIVYDQEGPGIVIAHNPQGVTEVACKSTSNQLLTFQPPNKC